MYVDLKIAKFYRFERWEMQCKLMLKLYLYKNWYIILFSLFLFLISLAYPLSFFWLSSRMYLCVFSSLLVFHYQVARFFLVFSLVTFLLRCHSCVFVVFVVFVSNMCLVMFHSLLYCSFDSFRLLRQTDLFPLVFFQCVFRTCFSFFNPLVGGLPA